MRTSPIQLALVVLLTALATAGTGCTDPASDSGGGGGSAAGGSGGGAGGLGGGGGLGGSGGGAGGQGGVGGGGGAGGQGGGGGAGGQGGSGGAGGQGGSGGTGGAGGSGGSAAICSVPTPVACEDEVILQMALQATTAAGGIENVADGAGFQSTVDATAGGAFANPPDAYVYAKFTEGVGLEKVSIDDESALLSMDWDIAFRRYVIRINSGDSGPGCVMAARLPPATTFETAAPPASEALYRIDDFFTDTCEFVADGSGLPSSPAAALASYYAYPGCLSMTGNIYAVRLASGRLVKLTITSYYAPQANQDYCEQNSAAAPAPNGSGTIGVRWAFLN